MPRETCDEDLRAGAPVQPVCPDEELIRRTLAGDREAFGELALRYEGPLFAHLRRLSGNRDDAEDLTQEALLRAYRNLPEFGVRAGFGRWLFRIGTNVAIDSLRRRGRLRMESAEELAELPDERAPSPSERLDEGRLQQRLGEAVEQLPPFMAAIVNLYYREQMKLGQIAEVFQRDVRSIAVSMHRARLRLRDILTRPGSEGDLRK